MFDYQGGKLTNKCTANCVSSKKKKKKRCGEGEGLQEGVQIHKGDTQGLPVQPRDWYTLLWRSLQYFHHVRARSVASTWPTIQKPKAPEGAEMWSAFSADEPLSSFPGTLKWPPRWCTRAPAARRCATPTARSTCSAPTERLSPSPTPMWSSADARRRTARPRRPPAGGGASRWSDASVHVPSVNFNGMWWLFFFFFFHIVIISVIPRYSFSS